jgi:hypothetical protein
MAGPRVTGFLCFLFLCDTAAFYPSEHSNPAALDATAGIPRLPNHSDCMNFICGKRFSYSKMIK